MDTPKYYGGFKKGGSTTHTSSSGSSHGGHGGSFGPTYYGHTSSSGSTHGGHGGTFGSANQSGTNTVSSTSFDGTSINLLGSLTHVEVPFIKVQIGEYIFGVYDKSTGTATDAQSAYTATKIKFPNYVKGLTITKINGQVNQYRLSIAFPITTNTDPNFFEKVFSSVSDSRKIIFSYGDMAMPSYIYKDEEAIITNVSTVFNAKSPVINYTVDAISSATLLYAGTYTFPGRRAKPSTVIEELLRDSKYKLTELFYGMRDVNKIFDNGLIARDDKIVNIEMKTNISIFDYLVYLVSCMTPTSDVGGLEKSGVYVINVVDDVSGVYQGPYFTVKKMTTGSLRQSALETYTIDMGFPSQNIVTDFSVDNNETYSLYYSYTNSITQEEYRYRINDNGKLEPIYAPLLSSGNPEYKTTEADRSWWTAVTEYPITAQLTLKGLIRPALLMSYVKLNMYYFGKKHISSGLYVISKQVDTIDETGFRTTLSLVRVAGDDEDTNISYTYDVNNNTNNRNNSQIGYKQPITGID